VAYIQQQQRLAKAILGRTFLMHPLRNAFTDMPFGANKHGILVVTVEDHLHSCESGILLHHTSKVAYKHLMAAESKKFEWIICNKVTACKSSALSKYPQGMIKKNFSKLTLSVTKRRS
jgi:hypothetical protein